MSMQIEAGIAMTAAEKYQYDAFISMDEIPADEAREIVEMIRHLGTSLDVKNLRANRKIITAGKKVKQAKEDAAAKAKRAEMDEKEQQEFKDLREKQQVWIFTQKFADFKASPAMAASYQKFAAKHQIATMTAVSLEGWWLNSRAELLPKPPPPPAPPPDLRPKLLSLPAHLDGQYGWIRTTADVKSMSVDELLKAQKVPEIRNRVAFILRNQL
jgi:predicted secreted protein